MAEPCPRRWVSAVLENDSEATDELWIKLMQWGEATARYKNQPEDVGRDAAIEAFHRIQRMKNGFQELGTDDESSFCKMCRVIVAHEILRIIPKRTRIVEQQLDEKVEAILPGRRDPEPRLTASELFQRIKPCLNELTDLRRKIVELRYFHERSPQEIATELERTPGAIYTAMHHALTQLQQCLRRRGLDAIEDALSP